MYINFESNELFPLMTKEWVNKILNFCETRQNCTILEHGSGTSTIFWAKQNSIKSLVSIEGSVSWGNKVKSWINDQSEEIKQKIDYNLIELDQEKLSSLSSLGGYIAWSDEHQEFWKPYTDFIEREQFNNKKFDLIIIDGYDRKRNFIKCIPFLKEGGWIIMHDMLPDRFDEHYPKNFKITDFEELELETQQTQFGNTRGSIGFVLKKR